MSPENKQAPSRQGKIQVGDHAPLFSLSTQNGTVVNLADFLGKNSVVVYFYPKDNTKGCTDEACSFRDNYEVFKQAGAEVIGVSSDSEESHQGFAAKHRLPFILLSDKKGELRKEYGVPSTLGVLPGRVTYVIDKQGVVRHIFNDMFNAQKHINEALTVVQSISKE
ncbi:MAG TPA: peroxiredoxin [Ktedonobacteraceae bacterium]